MSGRHLVVDMANHVGRRAIFGDIAAPPSLLAALSVPPTQWPRASDPDIDWKVGRSMDFSSFLLPFSWEAAMSGPG